MIAVWVGDGDLQAGVEKEISSRGLRDHVTITGWQDDVRPFVAAADLMLLPSLYESFGYVTAEAMAMGVPVVATKVTGTIDIIRNDNLGVLFERGDWETGADEIVRLLGSPDEMGRYGANGRDFVISTFTHASMRENLRQEYLSRGPQLDVLPSNVSSGHP